MIQDLNSLTDEELMAIYQEGNEKAFAVLYSRHSEKVYGYLKNSLRNNAFAQDVFQATFLKLHNNRSHYDPTFPFLPWLFTVCKSVMIDQIRKKSRIREDNNSVALDLAVAPDIAKPIALPNLSVLPVMQQEAVQLRYIQDLSFEEIAQRLETSPSNVRQLISRAVKKLKVIATKGSNDETDN